MACEILVQIHALEVLSLSSEFPWLGRTRPFDEHLNKRLLAGAAATPLNNRDWAPSRLPPRPSPTDVRPRWINISVHTEMVAYSEPHRLAKAAAEDNPR
jgi:hypothetical protein